MQFHNWQPFGTLRFYIILYESLHNHGLWIPVFAGFRSGNRVPVMEVFQPLWSGRQRVRAESVCGVKKSLAFFFSNLNKCWRKQFFSQLVMLQWPHNTGSRKQQLKDDKPSVFFFISVCSLLLPHRCTNTVAHTHMHTHLSTHHWASHFLFLSPKFSLRVLWQLSSPGTSFRAAHLFLCVVGQWCPKGRQGHGVFAERVPRGYTDKTNDGETKKNPDSVSRKRIIASQRSNLKHACLWAPLLLWMCSCVASRHTHAQASSGAAVQSGVSVVNHSHNNATEARRLWLKYCLHWSNGRTSISVLTTFVTNCHLAQPETWEFSLAGWWQW